MICSKVSRSGAEWVREQVDSSRARRIALLAETAAEARHVMVEGESGILAISPPHCRPIYEPSKRQLRWPNGAVATTYSGDEPDQLRGPQHDAAWADEPAKWKYPDRAWDNLEFGLRLGMNPRVVATTTPRPIPLLRQLLRDPMTVLTRGSTYDNIPNLPPTFIARVRSKYEGTRLGRQELHAEMLEDVPGALWTRQLIEAKRLVAVPCEPLRIVVAVDPAVSSGEGANETGIIVACQGVEVEPLIRWFEEQKEDWCFYKPKYTTSARGWDIEAGRKNEYLLIEAKYISGPSIAAFAGLIAAPLANRALRLKTPELVPWCCWAIGTPRPSWF